MRLPDRSTAVVLFSLSWWACGPADPSVGGALGDAGMGASDGRPADAGLGPADAGASPDLGNLDASVDDAGLPPDLASVGLSWSAPLELCNVWREGASLTDEVAAEAHVTLWPAARIALDPTRLRASVLGPTAIRRSAHGEGQWYVGEPAGPQLIRWGLRDVLGDPHLDATLVHSLGAAGAIVESIAMSARTGRPASVDWSDTLEVSFAYAPPGVAIERAVPLVPCRGAPHLEDAIEVLAGRGAMRDVTLIRSLRTLPPAEGSAPVHLSQMVVQLSDELDILALDGPLAQTYSAARHNHGEHSRYDFTRDPVNHSLFLAPEDGAERVPPGWTVERVDALDVGGAGPAQLEVVRLDTRDGQRATERIPTVTPRWRRVDDVDLARAAMASCAAPEVQAVGSAYDYLLQVVSCPGAGPLGRRVVLVAPVAFRHDARTVGERLTGAALTEEGRTLRVAVGQSVVELTDRDDAFMDLVVRDATGRVVTERPVEVERLVMPRPRDEQLAFSGPAGLEVEVARRWGAQGNGRSSVYAPLAIAVRFEGRRHRVEALDRLRYTSTHHNWHDVLEAEDGDLRLRWWVSRVDPPQGTFLRITHRDGRTLLPDTLLVDR